MSILSVIVLLIFLLWVCDELVAIIVWAVIVWNVGIYDGDEPIAFVDEPVAKEQKVEPKSTMSPKELCEKDGGIWLYDDCTNN